jgi:hypothetical protein
MTKKKEPVMLQGNKPTDDPKKYGLKFDGGKARWELVPFEELREIISVPQYYITTNNVYCLLNYNENNLFNKIIDLIFFCNKNNTHDFLRFVGFGIFLLLRGKQNTKEELDSSNSIFRWDLFDINEIQKIVGVYSYGAKLYGDYNWQMVSRERYFAALLRHFKTVRTKERFDSESGFLHLHHAIWNVLALMWIDNNKK